MSSAKRGEPLPGTCSGPYYSRYTEHKLVFNCHPASPIEPCYVNLPHHPCSVDNGAISIRSRSTDSQSLPSRYSSPDVNPDRRSLSTGEASFECPIYTGRIESSDGSLSPFPASPSDFREISPRFDVYSSPLSAFRSCSVESNQSYSSGSGAETAKDRRSAFCEKNSLINTNLKPKGKFANAVTKHAVTLFAAATFKLSHEKTQNKKLTVSCPDLMHERKADITKRQVNNTASYSDLGSFERANSEKIVRSKNKLTVPDIFTTSFTHSRDTDHKPTFTRNYSTKPATSQQNQPDLTFYSKSADSSPLPWRFLQKSDSDELKISRLLLPTMYRDEQLVQITEYMFIGSIESAYNERRLCRLEIESLVDISNLSEMQVPPHKKLQCPCLCKTETKHFRSRLIIAVPDEENDGIDQYFEEVNKFIEGARRCSKKVLLYSYEGKSRAPLFAIQYLMGYEGLLLRQAYSMVKKQWPQVSMNPSFQKSIEKLEKTLYPDERHSVNICNEYLNVADPQAIKCAWIDC